MYSMWLNNTCRMWANVKILQGIVDRSSYVAFMIEKGSNFVGMVSSFGVKGLLITL